LTVACSVTCAPAAVHVIRSRIASGLVPCWLFTTL